MQRDNCPSGKIFKAFDNPSGVVLLDHRDARVVHRCTRRIGNGRSNRSPVIPAIDSGRKSRRARGEQDHRGADETYRTAEQIPSIGPNALDGPKP